MDFRITENELQHQYERTRLADIGMTFQDALNSNSVRIALTAAAKGHRRLQMRLSMSGAIEHQVREDA